jgi:hypothetical protein
VKASLVVSFSNQFFTNSYFSEIPVSVPCTELYNFNSDRNQGCGSGSGLDPDSVTCVDPDPYWESGSGSRGKKMKKFQWKNALFSYIFKNILPLKF